MLKGMAILEWTQSQINTMKLTGVINDSHPRTFGCNFQPSSHHRVELVSPTFRQYHDWAGVSRVILIVSLHVTIFKDFEFLEYYVKHFCIFFKFHVTFHSTLLWYHIVVMKNFGIRVNPVHEYYLLLDIKISGTDCNSEQLASDMYCNSVEFASLKFRNG